MGSHLLEETFLLIVNLGILPIFQKNILPTLVSSHLFRKIWSWQMWIQEAIYHS
jgi:hypothetical protein